MERFLYEVRPNRPIHIPGQSGIKKPFVSLLTLDEVREYMKYGPVYRKYADPNKEMVRVTGENMNKLHSAADDKPVGGAVSVAEILDKIAEKEAPVIKEVVEAEPEPVEETVEEVTEEPVVEEPAVEEPVVEEKPVKKAKTEKKPKSYKLGASIKLKNTELYKTSVSSTVLQNLTGTFYIANERILNNRIRVSDSKSGDSIGWITL